MKGTKRSAVVMRSICAQSKNVNFIAILSFVRCGSRVGVFEASFGLLPEFVSEGPRVGSGFAFVADAASSRRNARCNQRNFLRPRNYNH
jgi:hypothetical protein